MEESLTGRVAIEHLSENNSGSLIPGIVYAKVKRLWDLRHRPAAAAAAAASRCGRAADPLDSPGPIFFRQQRMGYRGHPFTDVQVPLDAARPRRRRTRATAR
jgi:lipopolysaccharide/colanic/teichoic acid biosynthesis glycosyltransferase